MINAKRNRLLPAFILVLTLFIFTLSSSLVIGQDDPLNDIHTKLTEISDDEKEVLQRLFILSQEIEALEKEEEKIAQEIEIINSDIQKLEENIKLEEKAYKDNLNILEKVVKSYQRKGAGSYLEIILSSESLDMLLQRLNILSDLTRGTGELLASLEESRENLTREKSELAEKLNLVENNKKQLELSINNKVKTKEEIESYLASLAEERELYQVYLENVEKMWSGLKPLFSDMTTEFSNIIESGNVPEDAMDISFSISGIKGTINEETFNSIIAENKLLPQMTIDFTADKMTLHLHKENLILSGQLVVEKENNLKFEAIEGSFYGMPLEYSSIEELFEEGQMIIALQSVLGDNTLRSVDIEEDKLVLTIIPKLF